MFNVQERLILTEVGLTSNKFFVVAVALSVLGQLAVIYLPPLQYIFQGIDLFQLNVHNATDSSLLFHIGKMAVLHKRPLVCHKKNSSDETN